VKNISDEYLLGFVEGEGCFYVSIVPSKETSSGWQVIHFFKVSQNPRGQAILQALKERLDCGYIKTNASKTSTDKSLAYVVRNNKDLREKVIPFFKNKLIIKNDDFVKFSKIVEIVALKQHLDKKGVEEVINISYSMNTSKRKYSKDQILTGFS
jgi:hypothetical protein